MRREIFTTLVVILTVSTVMAYMASTWSVVNSMTVVKRDLNVTAFSDEECTKPLTSISWGEVKQGEWVEKIFWIKNVGSDNGTASWYSDLRDVVGWDNVYEEMYYWNETLGEWVYWCKSWFVPPPPPTIPTPTVPIKQYKPECQPWMEPGDVVKVKYRIKPLASCQPSEYSWTLYLGWEK